MPDESTKKAWTVSGSFTPKHDYTGTYANDQLTRFCLVIHSKARRNKAGGDISADIPAKGRLSVTVPDCAASLTAPDGSISPNYVHPVPPLPKELSTSWLPLAALRISAPLE